MAKPITFDIRVEALPSLVISELSAWRGLATSVKPSDAMVKWLDPSLSRYGESAKSEDLRFWHAVAYQETPLPLFEKREDFAKTVSAKMPAFKKDWDKQSRLPLSSYAADLREALSNIQVQRDLEQLPKLVSGEGTDYRVNLVFAGDRATSMFAVGDNLFIAIGKVSRAREDFGQLVELISWQILRQVSPKERKVIDDGLSKSDLPRELRSPELFDEIMAITVGKAIIQAHVSDAVSSKTLTGLGNPMSSLAKELATPVAASLSSGKSIFDKEILDAYVTALKGRKLQ